MNLYQQLNDSSGMATIYNESGVAFENKGDYAEAERRYTAGLQLNQALGDSVGISYSLGFLSGLYAGQHQYTRAEPLALQVLQMREQLKDSFALAIAATNVGELYAQMGVSAKAATYLLRSNRIASAIGFTDIMAHNYGLLAGLAEAQGNYKEALAYTKEQTTLQDSIMQVAKMKQIEELSTRYETAEKELKIQEQGFALKRKNLLIALVAALAVLTGLTALYLYKRRQYKHRQELERQQRLQQEQSTRAVMEAEENERRRIAAELHDGVGQLMSAARMNLGALEPELKTLAPDLQSRFDKIIGLVDESCREVRAVSHSMMPNALLKRGLAAAIRDFVEKIDNRVIKVQLHAEGLDRRLEPAVE
ncbi:MAG TPA: histidine kinase, partial [Phnomibacter sp.]|nr:histidine kinase [Phnomibacter sp.]